MKLRLPLALLVSLAACAVADTNPALDSIPVPTESVTGSGENNYMVKIEGDYDTSWHVAAKDLTWNESYTFDKGPLNVGSALTEATLRVDGEGTTFATTANLFIGCAGWGITTSDINKPHTGTVYVGQGAVLDVNSSSTDPSNSQLNVGAGGSYAQYRHEGFLIVDGGTVKAGNIHVANGYGDVKGTLILNNGGTVTACNNGGSTGTIIVGYHADSDGKIIVEGGSKLKAEGYTVVGYGTDGESTGKLTVADNSTADLGAYLFVGRENGSSGQVVVEGEGSQLTAGTTYLGWSEGSEGSMTVSEDASAKTGMLFVGCYSGSSGVVNVDGGNLNAGSTWIGGGEKGELNVGDGASVVVDGSLTVQSGGSEAPGQVNISGNATSLEVTGSSAIANGGSVIVDNGATWTTKGDNQIDFGSKVTVDNGSTWNSAGNTTVSSGATVVMGEGADWESRGDISFETGSSLVFEVVSTDKNKLPAINAGNNKVNFAEEATVTYRLAVTIVNSPTDEFVLPSITGDVDTLPDTVVIGPDGEQMSGEGTELVLLPDGRYGLMVKLDQEFANAVLGPDGMRLANTLWSSTGVVQDYADAVLARLERPGSDHVWGMGLGSFQRMSAHGAVSGFHYNGGGYAVGADHSFSNKLLGGVSFGQVHGIHKASDGMATVRQNTAMASLYGRYVGDCNKCGNTFILDGYLSYGHTRNRARCISDLDGSYTTGRWGDEIFAFGFKASWERRLSEHYSLASFIGLRYLYGSQGDFLMSTGDASRRYYDGSMHNCSLPMGLTLRARYALGSKSIISPELTVGYMADIFRKTPYVRTDVLGNSTKFEGSDPGRHAFMMRAGVGCQIDEHWSAGAGYNLEYRRSDLDQTVDVNVSYSF